MLHLNDEEGKGDSRALNQHELVARNGSDNSRASPDTAFWARSVQYALPMGKSGAGDGTCELLRHVDARHSQATFSLVRLNLCVYIMLSSSTLVGTLIDYILAQELAAYYGLPALLLLTEPALRRNAARLSVF